MRIRFQWTWAWQALACCLLVTSVQAQTRAYRDFSDSDTVAPTSFAENLGKEPSEAPIPGTSCSSCGGEAGNCSCTQGGGNSCNSCQSCNKGCGNSCGGSYTVNYSGDDFWYGCCNSCDRRWGGYVYSYGEGFRGTADGNFGGNGGGATGVNLGRQVSGAWGVQLGGSYGTYDWRGRTSGNEATVMQSQLFFTGGIYRKASCDSPVSFGLLYDMMVNDNFGSASHEPFLTQFRIQTGYAINEQNEIGFWTALADRNAQQGGPAVSYRAINTYNLYLNHKFCGGAQSNSWIGAAQQSRIGPAGALAPVAGTGSVYTLVLGNYTVIPITCRLSGYTSVMYGIPSASNGVAAARDETYSIQAGMIFYPRRNSRTRSVSGAAWMPYMPVANNGTFLVDANGAP